MREYTELLVGVGVVAVMAISFWLAPTTKGMVDASMVTAALSKPEPAQEVKAPAKKRTALDDVLGARRAAKSTVEASMGLIHPSPAK